MSSSIPPENALAPLSRHDFSRIPVSNCQTIKMNTQCLPDVISRVFVKKTFLHIFLKTVVLAVIVNVSIFPTACTWNKNMISKRTGQVPIVFTYTGRCETVCLSGDFNGWAHNTHCLKRNGATWEIKLFLSPGRYKYAFVLDGTHWIPDPDAYLQEDDGFGTKNSVLIVE